MSLHRVLEGKSPPKHILLYIALSAAMLLAVCALAPPKALASQDETEPGIVYVQHRVTSESGGVHTTAQRAYSTLTEDKQAYTARVNASGGAISIEGHWRVDLSGTDITEECSYDESTGLILIPTKYMDSPVKIKVDLDTDQSKTTFPLNVSVVSGTQPGDTSTHRVETTATSDSISVPVKGKVKAVTQDSRVLDKDEYSLANGMLSIEGLSPLSGSFTIYLDSFEPEITQRNAIKDYRDTIIQRSLRSGSASMLARSNLGSSFGGWGWIRSTNQGPGDWDYTDYVMTWDGRTMYLNCCQHGTYHMLQSEGKGGKVRFTASRTSNKLVKTYDTYNSTTTYHHKVYRNTYYVYVDAGPYYQDVDGKWSEDYETVTSKPRLGGIDLRKVSASPSITNGSSSYSTSGAVYGIFSDAKCTSKLNSMTTDSNGKASFWGLRAGTTVYVKETKASSGYDLDKKVYRASIVADTYAHIGTVCEPPKTATVRYYVDGASSPVYVHQNVPLGSFYGTDNSGLVTATDLARKPNCTPGLDAWYADKTMSKRFTGATIRGDLNLYARNIATLTYAVAPSSALMPELNVRAEMDKSYPLLDIHRDILPAARQVNWGATASLAEPKLSIVYSYDGKRWRTLRRSEIGWYDNPAIVGASFTSMRIEGDVVVYTDYTLSTFDGIVMW